MRIVKFVIIGAPRTGSSFLQSALNSHPQTICLREVFGDCKNRGKFYLNGKITDSIDSPKEYLEAEIWNPEFSNKTHRGFKLFFMQGIDTKAPKTIWNIIEEDKDVRIIYLRRQNLLARFCSQRMAYTTGVWELKKLSTAKSYRELKRYFAHRLLAYRGVSLTYQECVSDFEKHERFHDEFMAKFSTHQVLDLSYESLVENREKAYQEVLNFLELPYVKFKTEHTKQFKPKLSSSVKNYLELKSQFAGSKWDVFFDSQ